jgi:hypothetical protein
MARHIHFRVENCRRKYLFPPHTEVKKFLFGAFDARGIAALFGVSVANAGSIV